jgi:hypothetical protein
MGKPGHSDAPTVEGDMIRHDAAMWVLQVPMGPGHVEGWRRRHHLARGAGS